jgi:hypothetical protein
LKYCEIENPPHRGCAGGRIGTWFLRPRGTSPLKGVNPAGTPGYRNGTESFFGLKGRPFFKIFTILLMTFGSVPTVLYFFVFHCNLLFQIK